MRWSMVIRKLMDSQDMRGKLRSGFLERSRDKEALVRISTVFGLCRLMVTCHRSFF